MGFKDDARNRIDCLVGKLPYISTTTKIDPFCGLISLLNLELGSDSLANLHDFVKEYDILTECSFGYLLEPYGEILSLKPKLQKTKKANSPYFCAKIPIRGMGNVYLVPLKDLSISPFALILKPDRTCRRTIEISRTIIVPSQLSVLSPPYPHLLEALTNWAIVKEASLRKK